MMGALLGALAIVVWWVFFSRAPWSERWGAIVLMIVALVATSRLVHESIATGMMGMMFLVYAIPVLSLAFVAWAVASRRLSDGLRRATMVAAILLACGAWTLVRTGGITGDAVRMFAWRWTKTPEERLLAQAGDEPAPLAYGAAGGLRQRPSPAGGSSAASRCGPAGSRSRRRSRRAPAAAKTAADWPGFRGPDRDGVVRGVRIETDWSGVAAGRAVAPADRTGLVVLRGPRRPPLHPGAAR